MSRALKRGPPTVGITHPQRALAAAVIQMAWDDLGALKVRSCEDRSNGGIPTVAQVAEAMAFLTDSYGPWRLARVLWADAAGVDPEVLRERALARMEQAGAAHG